MKKREELTSEIVEMPDWIKKAKKNGAARVRYQMKKYGLTQEQAEQKLSQKQEQFMQGESDNFGD